MSTVVVNLIRPTSRPAQLRVRLLCVSVALAWITPAGAEALNLARAYEAARLNDPTFRAAIAARDAGKEEKILGRAQLLPTIAATYTTNRNTTRSTQGQITASTETTQTSTATSTSTTTNDRLQTASAFTGPLSSQPRETQRRVTDSETDTHTDSAGHSTVDETEIETNKFRDTSTALQLRQPLINFGAMAGYRQGKALTAASEARFRSQQQELMVRVAEVYAGALFAEESRRLALTQLITLTEQQTTNERMLSSGEGTLTDVLETRAKRELAQAQLIEAEDALLVARNRLIVMTGLRATSFAPLKTDIVTTSTLASTPEEWRELALSQNGLLEALRYQVEAANQEVNKAESGHYPRLDLVATLRRENFRSNVNPISNTTTSVSDSNSTSSTTGSTSNVHTGSAPILNESSNSNFTTTSLSDTTSNSRFNAEQNLSTRRRTTNHVVGVEFNMPLFSGGAVSSRTRQVAARLIQAQAEMDARVDEVLLELNRQLRLQQSTTLRVKALEQAVESSRIAVDATIKSTAAGVRTNLDVLNARERLVTAESELAEARYAHLLAFLRLRFNAGVLTEDDLMQLAGR